MKDMTGVIDFSEILCILPIISDNMQITDFDNFSVWCNPLLSFSSDCEGNQNIIYYCRIWEI